MRFFNTEGPIRPEDHYSLPPLGRWDLDEILRLIEQKKYFLLHAPRQTGKTTCLLALMEHLNREGRYRAVYANLEIAQTAREDVARGMRAICGAIGAAARRDLGEERLLRTGPMRSGRRTGAEGGVERLAGDAGAARRPQPGRAAARRGRCPGRRYPDLAAAPVARRLPPAPGAASRRP